MKGRKEVMMDITKLGKLPIIKSSLKKKKGRPAGQEAQLVKSLLKSAS